MGIYILYKILERQVAPILTLNESQMVWREWHFNREEAVQAAEKTRGTDKTMYHLVKEEHVVVLK